MSTTNKKIGDNIPQQHRSPFWLVLLLAAALAALGCCAGWHQLNSPLNSKYNIRGVDVSSYQGEIDWQVIASQDIDFAYIKASEGSDTRDRYFAQNANGAASAGLAAGAYHFFSFDSAGETQADNFLAAIGDAPLTLPPAVDVEPYGDYFLAPAPKERVVEQLSALLERLRAHYGVQPVIYATADSYERYIAGSFPDSPVWIRSVVTPPLLRSGGEWTFWQYSCTTRLRGIYGGERFVDMNVFNGNSERFSQLLLAGKAAA